MLALFRICFLQSSRLLVSTNCSLSSSVIACQTRTSGFCQQRLLRPWITLAGRTRRTATGNEPAWTTLSGGARRNLHGSSRPTSGPCRCMDFFFFLKRRASDSGSGACVDRWSSCCQYCNGQNSGQFDSQPAARRCMPTGKGGGGPTRAPGLARRDDADPFPSPARRGDPAACVAPTTKRGPTPWGHATQAEQAIERTCKPRGGCARPHRPPPGHGGPSLLLSHPARRRARTEDRGGARFHSFYFGPYHHPRQEKNNFRAPLAGLVRFWQTVPLPFAALLNAAVATGNAPAKICSAPSEARLAHRVISSFFLHGLAGHLIVSCVQNLCRLPRILMEMISLFPRPF